MRANRELKLHTGRLHALAALRKALTRPGERPVSHGLAGQADLCREGRGENSRA